MMVIYEVSLFIEEEIYFDFKLWLKEHVAEMLKFKGFIEAKILSESENALDNAKEKNLIVHYLVDDQKNLHDYFTDQSTLMRQKGINAFGNKFRAQRKIFHVEEI